MSDRKHPSNSLKRSFEPLPQESSSKRQHKLTTSEKQHPQQQMSDYLNSCSLEEVHTFFTGMNGLKPPLYQLNLSISAPFNCKDTFETIIAGKTLDALEDAISTDNTFDLFENINKNRAKHVWCAKLMAILPQHRDSIIKEIIDTTLHTAHPFLSVLHAKGDIIMIHATRFPGPQKPFEYIIDVDKNTGNKTI